MPRTFWLLGLDVDECARGTSGCSQNCTNTIGSFECSCFSSGYKLINGKNCTDIDECALEIDDCHVNATCLNTIGSFKCTCDPGFQGDGKNCSG